MKKLILVLIVVAALAFGALRYHVIVFDNQIKILKKTELTFTDTYVDARGTKKLKLLTKPDLVKAGIKDLLTNDGITLKK